MKWTAVKEKGYTAVATFVCSRCKDSQDVTADVVKEDKNSQIIYTATAKYTDKTGKEFTATATKSTKMSVSYIVHCQDYGWEEDWKKDGQTSGTEGQCKRLVQKDSVNVWKQSRSSYQVVFLDLSNIVHIFRTSVGKRTGVKTEQYPVQKDSVNVWKQSRSD